MYFKEVNMPDQCPPKDAVSDNQANVYRFINGENPTAEDFLNHKEAKRPYPDFKECEAIALSFFTEIPNVNKRSKALRNKKAIKGNITDKCGVHTLKNKHINLWLFKEVDILKVFLGEEGLDEHN